MPSPTDRNLTAPINLPSRKRQESGVTSMPNNSHQMQMHRHRAAEMAIIMGGWLLVTLGGGLSPADAQGIAPPAPPQVQLTQTGTTVRLDWEAVPEADHYTVFRGVFDVGNGQTIWGCRRSESTGNWLGCRELASGVNGTSHVDSPDATGHVSGGYSYWVTACNRQGCSPTSGSPAVALLGPPDAPFSFDVVDRNYDSLTITWKAKRASHIEVYRSRSPGEGAVLVGSVTDERHGGGHEFALNPVFARYTLQLPVTDARYRDERLDQQTVYWYRLKACNSFGCSDFSSEVGVITEAPGVVAVPSAPTGVRGLAIEVPGTNEAEVTWSAVSGATYYEVYQGSTFDATVSAPRNSYRDRVPNSSFFSMSRTAYSIRACNKCGCSESSNEIVVNP